MQTNPEELFHDRAEAHSIKAEQPCSEFRVEQAFGRETQRLKASEILAGRVKDPLFTPQGFTQRLEGVERDGVEQKGAGSASVDLHQVGIRAIPKSRGSLGVHPCWALSRGQALGSPFQACSIGDE